MPADAAGMGLGLSSGQTAVESKYAGQAYPPAIPDLHGMRARWRIQPAISGHLRSALNGRSVMLAHLLYCRGFQDVEQIDTFLAGADISHDPFAISDMEPAVQRIRIALETGERVAVYGDFDCDGITSTAVLVHALRALGIDPIAHIPERRDGHGLHPETLATLHERGVTLVITADCGATDIEEVRVARGLGMDVIVTDHHEVHADGSLPDCLVLNPSRLDSSYPFRSLAGVGVAYKLVQALAARLESGLEPDIILDLVALGTVADVAPLLDENRALVIRGLRLLQKRPRPGLTALFEVAGVERDNVDPSTVSYYLAPRINAANRMSSPTIAYELLMASKKAAASALAQQLNGLNQDRQLLVEEKFLEIAEELGDPKLMAAEFRAGQRAPILFIVGEWPSGISGLLASQLVQTYGVAAFAGSRSEDSTISVSGRAGPGVHLQGLLEASEAAVPSGLFLNYGGHAAAAGFRIESGRLDEVVRVLETQARGAVRIEEVGAEMRVDAEVSLSSLSLNAAQLVQSLAPFGMGFPEPLFLARGVTVRSVTSIKDGKHARICIGQQRSRMDGMCFNINPEMLELAPGDVLDVVFHLQIDEWNGRLKPEIAVCDWRRSA
ncbi:MAG: single-stranded-DNA-specific exonuclease RecJ [Chloroflexota bacterium]